MACPEFESRIPDHLDGRLPPTDRLALEEHLADCAACRGLAASLRQLDTVLGRSIQSRGVSPGFRARLWRRIESESGMTTEIARAEGKRRAQAEFEAQIACIRHGMLHPGRWLDLAGLAVVLGLVGQVLGRLALTLTEVSATQGLSDFEGQIPAVTVIGLTLIFIGIGAGLWNAARRTWLAV